MNIQETHKEQRKEMKMVLPKDKISFDKYLAEINIYKVFRSYTILTCDLLTRQGYEVTRDQIRNCKSGRYDRWEILNGIRIVYGFQPVEIPSAIPESVIAKAFGLQKPA